MVAAYTLYAKNLSNVRKNTQHFQLMVLVLNEKLPSASIQIKFLE